MDQQELRARFPSMTPIDQPPSLFRINGCGVSVFGRRDEDRPTGTYVKTWCITFLFAPVLALRAYRVADADEGWYFLGREPLSDFAKLWNAAFVSTLLALVGWGVWSSHTSSPEYQAAQALARAEAALLAGRTGEATAELRAAGRSRTEHALAARERLRRLVDERVDAAAPAEAASLLRTLLEVELATGSLAGRAEPLAERIATRAEAELDRAPRTAVALLAAGDPLVELARAAAEEEGEGEGAAVPATSPLARALGRLDAVRDRALTLVVAAAPEDPGAASDLATLCWRTGRRERAGALLEPHEGRLGSSDGARLLGLLRLGQERLEDAARLLTPWVEARLPALAAADRRHDAALEAAWKRAVEVLGKGDSSDFNYVAYKVADEARQQAMVQAWAAPRVRADAEVQTALAALRGAAAVVPVALDLGFARLALAGRLGEPERRRELEAAERVLGAVGGVAGESERFRLQYGQVCYWLGRQDEGRALFDQLLGAAGRSPESLLQVAGALRQVGALSEARQLAEEAWSAAKEDEERHAAAYLRAVTPLDRDDRVTWLERADQGSPEVRASVEEARAQQALEQGRRDEAVERLRKAVAAYGAMPTSGTNLNNQALAARSLFLVTFAAKDLAAAVALQEKAVALEPGNAIALGNLADLLLERAVYDVAGAEVDQPSVQWEPDLSLLRALEADAAARERHVRALEAHPAFPRALACFDKVSLLSPRSPEPLAKVQEFYTWARRLEPLRALAKKAAAATLDLTDETSRALERLRGDRDAQTARYLQQSLRDSERVLQGIPRGERPREWALAVQSWCGTRCGAAQLTTAPADLDAVVATAEQARAAAPTVGGGTLEAALLVRATRQLGAAQPALAAFADRWRRSLGGIYLLALAAELQPSLRPALASHADLRRVATAWEQERTRFPYRASPSQWALLRHLDPPAAERVAALVRSDEVTRLDRQLDAALQPVSPAALLEQYWALRLAGQDDEARRSYAAALGRSVPLPPLAP